jgi:hypothetical protein
MVAAGVPATRSDLHRAEGRVHEFLELEDLRGCCGRVLAPGDLGVVRQLRGLIVALPGGQGASINLPEVGVDKDGIGRRESRDEARY